MDTEILLSQPINKPMICRLSAMLVDIAEIPTSWNYAASDTSQSASAMLSSPKSNNVTQAQIRPSKLTARLYAHIAVCLN
ncbi:hypothetical protein BITS_1689 [Bifidobacterium tsurumiense]|uniref:Uncharacterized protein n=1 Tax=Bifidobacterium tsurumiense TaxID=356829 RepID=A0A087EBJ0_9BIFI|nr:hypothetical protein BITS_1689 [Bifidobacterium tsurumiense]